MSPMYYEEPHVFTMGTTMHRADQDSAVLGGRGEKAKRGVVLGFTTGS